MNHSQPHQARVRQVQDILREGPLDYVFLSISPDLFYLTGYSSFVSERLHLMVIPATGRPTLVFPAFEVEMVAHLSGWIDIVGWQETESPITYVCQALAENDRTAPLQIAISDHTRSVFLLRLQAALPHAQFVAASQILAPLRRTKDDTELAILRQAQAMAVTALKELFAQPLAGRTEQEVARELRRLCEAVGFENALGAQVGSGPNGALPHLAPTERVIQSGEPLLIDFGAVHRGYYSDCTRTVHIGPPSDEFVNVFETVRRANHAALDAIRPGAVCEEIDHAARQVIDEAGYGQFFTHRLGHGIGIEVHEEPYMVAGNRLALAPGMTFTNEPGIYLPGKFGCRLEDVVAVTNDGGVALTQYTHDLLVID